MALKGGHRDPGSPMDPIGSIGRSSFGGGGVGGLTPLKIYDGVSKRLSKAC